MGQVTNSPSNDVRLEIDVSKHQIVSYQDNYKLLGRILLGVSFFPFFLMLVAPWPIWLVIGAFWLVPFAFGINLGFKEHRKLWDYDSQMVLSEVRWPGRRFKLSGKMPIRDFEDVQIMATSRAQKSETTFGSAGVLVRMRHRKDSRHFYTGNKSWVLGQFQSTDYAEEARLLAETVSQECGIPVRDSLGY